MLDYVLNHNDIDIVRQTAQIVEDNRLPCADAHKAVICGYSISLEMAGSGRASIMLRGTICSIATVLQLALDAYVDLDMVHYQRYWKRLSRARISS